jgi:hypothetical protein
MTVTAVKHIRRMRGGAQGQLLDCSDGNFYVVKFRNNPQHVRVLSNELLAGRLAELVGLPVAVSRVVEVSAALVRDSPEMNIILAGNSTQCESGLHFGSRYAVDLMKGRVVDWLSVEMFSMVRNFRDFAGVLAFDKWAGNTDGRQAVFCRTGRQRNIAPASSTRGIASMRVIGRFRIIRFAACSHVMSRASG